MAVTSKAIILFSAAMSVLFSSYGQKQMHVDPLSCTSLMLFCPNPQNPQMGLQGTGFVVTQNGTNYLISNWHVLSGRAWPTMKAEMSMGTNQIVPTNVIIYFRKTPIGGCKPILESLYDSNGVALWFEHQLGGTNIDVVALPLPSIHDDEIVIMPLDLGLAETDILLGPAMAVSIIGFPRYITIPNDMPLWKTGYIASDPDLDNGGFPRFLVGVNARPGMSGCAGAWWLWESRSCRDCILCAATCGGLT